MSTKTKSTTWDQLKKAEQHLLDTASNPHLGKTYNAKVLAAAKQVFKLDHTIVSHIGQN